ncbi:MAG: YdeI/OmpD-associated family protein [Bacteroidota bacterium]
MKRELNPRVDKYLVDGCMRCKYGGTRKCKVLNWVKELELLRQIVLETGLTEEIKWGVPVYTNKGKNIVAVSALKHSANIGFFKGVLLTDKYKILQQQGNLQSDRIAKFTTTNEIIKLKDILVSYVLEAIEIEVSGKKVEFKKNPEPVPEELKQRLHKDPIFKSAFEALTPGRRRGYIIHFSQPKQSKTRISRIEKNIPKILEGKGWNER